LTVKGISRVICKGIVFAFLIPKEKKKKVKQVPRRKPKKTKRKSPP